MDITTFNIRKTPSAMGNDMELGNLLSNIKTSNELSYQSSPMRTNNMTLHNDEEAFYVPTVEITIAYMGNSDYATFMQLVNSKGIMVYYFDFELNEYVWRAMYVSEKSLDQLHAIGGNGEGLVGVKVTFVSRWGYPYVPSSNVNCQAANKYHMYNLYRLKNLGDDPSGEGYPSYA